AKAAECTQSLGVGHDNSNAFPPPRLIEIGFPRGGLGAVERYLVVSSVTERLFRRLSAPAKCIFGSRLEDLTLLPSLGTAISVGPDSLARHLDRTRNNVRPIPGNQY